MNSAHLLSASLPCLLFLVLLLLSRKLKLLLSDPPKAAVIQLPSSFCTGAHTANPSAALRFAASPLASSAPSPRSMYATGRKRSPKLHVAILILLGFLHFPLQLLLQKKLLLPLCLCEISWRLKADPRAHRPPASPESLAFPWRASPSTAAYPQAPKSS